MVKYVYAGKVKMEYEELKGKWLSNWGSSIELTDVINIEETLMKVFEKLYG